MTNQEQDLKIIQTRQEVDDFKTVIESFIGEMRDRDNQRAEEARRLGEEMRDRDNRRAEEIREVREKNETVANNLRAEIRDATRDIRALTIAAVVGIAAIVVEVFAFIWQSINFMWQLETTRQPIYQQPPAQTQPANQNFSPQK